MQRKQKEFNPRTDDPVAYMEEAHREMLKREQEYRIRERKRFDEAVKNINLQPTRYPHGTSQKSKKFRRRLLGKPIIGGYVAYLGLEDWYGSLTPDQKTKLARYWGYGMRVSLNNSNGKPINDLIEDDPDIIRWKSNMTPNHFFASMGYDAILDGDYDFGIQLSKAGLKANGPLLWKHFSYSNLITAYFKKCDFEQAKYWCLEEQKEFPHGLERALKEEFGPDYEIVNIPCLDLLPTIESFITGIWPDDEGLSAEAIEEAVQIYQENYRESRKRRGHKK